MSLRHVMAKSLWLAKPMARATGITEADDDREGFVCRQYRSQAGPKGRALDRIGLKNAKRGRGRHNPRKFELSLGQEPGKFATRALPTPRRHHQHLEVEQKCFGRLPGLSNPGQLSLND